MARTGQWNMSLDVARRVALGAQGFADPRPKSTVDRRHLRRVMGRMNVLQLDSVPVVIRTQYLPIHSRLGPYRTDLLDEIAYRDDAWFETWAHEASLLPVEDEPLTRWLKERARNGHTWKGLAELAAKEPAYVEDVLAEVRERGAVTGGELSDPRKLDDDGTGWWSRSLGVLALDWLFRIGELGIRRRGNFEKVFSPIEDIVPEQVLRSPTPSIEQTLRRLIRKSARSLGVGTAADIADYYRLPIKMVRAMIPELVEDGELVPATVAGWDKPAFADPEARIPRKIIGQTVLSPFDPIVWNRDRLLRLWGFDYRIEIYVPAAKRRWGYYVLPVMVDGEIVARLDAKTDRAQGVLRIKAAHGERGFDDAGTAERVGSAVEDLARLLEVQNIEIEERGDLSHLLVDRFSTP